VELPVQMKAVTEPAETLKISARRDTLKELFSKPRTVKIVNSSPQQP